MSDMNLVALSGNLTKDADLRYIPSGTAVLEFRVASNRTYFVKGRGEQKEVAYVNCKIWGGRAEALNQFLTKGTRVLIKGRLQFQEWERDGQRHSRLEINVEDLNFMGGRKPAQDSTDVEASVSPQEPVEESTPIRGRVRTKKGSESPRRAKKEVPAVPETGEAVAF
jgi:single-strand DNA-binding protein